MLEIRLPDESLAVPSLATRDITHSITVVGGFVSPLSAPYNAEGDGADDDSGEYAAADAALATVFLDYGKTFNIEAYVPVRGVWGPGSLMMDGDTYGDFLPLSYPERSSLYWTPNDEHGDDWLFSTFPASSGHGNTVVGAGNAIPKVANADFVRITSFGSLNFANPETIDRLDIFGQGAARNAVRVERSGGFGTLTLVHPGADPTTLAAKHHDLWWPVLPSDGAWDVAAMETRNPGVRSLIAAVTQAATSAEVLGNWAFGRDALNELIKGVSNVAVGYGAHTFAYFPNRNASVGTDALRDGLFADDCAALGNLALRHHQVGAYTTAVGADAGSDDVTGIQNTYIGGLAGADGWANVDRVLLLGYSAGWNVTPANDTFLVQNAPSQILLWGNFNTGRMAMGHTVSETGASIVPKFQVHGTTASSASNGNFRWSNDAGGSRMLLAKSRGATAGTHGIVQSGDVIADYTFAADDGVALLEAAWMRAIVEGTPGVDDMPTCLAFGVTADGQSTVTERMRLSFNGNLKIGGTANRGGTESTKSLVLFDGTAPIGTLTNGVSFYCASGEARVMDAAGNSTLLSPHDRLTNEWVFDSVHSVTGRRLRMRAEKILRFINDKYGLDCIEELQEAI